MSDHHSSDTGIASGSGIARAGSSSTNRFFILAGPSGRPFTFDIDEIRKESWLFNSHPSITSIELRNEDPAAVEIIEDWFKGCIGIAPITPESRETFHAAARIAKDLHFWELENQLDVILRKSSAAFIDLLLTHMLTIGVVDLDIMNEYLLLEMEPFLARTRVEDRDQSGNGSAFCPVYDATG